MEEELVFYTVKEVAEMLQLHTQSVRRLLDDGELAWYRVGRSIRIGHADFMAYLEERRHTGPAKVAGVRLASVEGAKRAHDPKKRVGAGKYGIVHTRSKKGL